MSARKYIAFSRSSRISLGAALRQMKPVVETYKKELLRLPDLATLVSSQPSEALTLAFGSQLSEIIVTGFIRGSRAARKPPKRKVKNTVKPPRIHALKDIDVESWLNDHFNFAWDLGSVNAVSSFTAEAFDYAGKSMAELLESLITDARKVLESGGSFLDWKENLVLQGFEPGNPYHLRTNFDTAANSSFAAGAWKEIQEYSDIFPYLRYVTMQDELVRDEHLALDGTVLPVDDLFWLTFYPPNGYNCRCSVEQLTSLEAEGDPLFGRPGLTAEIDPRFAHNSGITNTIWS